jgi:hypothetical protein
MLPAQRQLGRETHGDKGLIATACDETAPPPDGATDSHNHVKVVAVFKRRVDNHHGACDAHGVLHRPDQGEQPLPIPSQRRLHTFRDAPAILILRVSGHWNKLTERIVTQ